jgi:hypothetical protein
MVRAAMEAERDGSEAFCEGGGGEWAVEVEVGSADGPRETDLEIWRVGGA